MWRAAWASMMHERADACNIYISSRITSFIQTPGQHPWTIHCPLVKPGKLLIVACCARLMMTSTSSEDTRLPVMLEGKGVTHVITCGGARDGSRNEMAMDKRWWLTGGKYATPDLPVPSPRRRSWRFSGRSGEHSVQCLIPRVACRCSSLSTCQEESRNPD